MDGKEFAYRPMDLKGKLDPGIYGITIFRAEEDADPEGEFCEELEGEAEDEGDNEDIDIEPFMVYKFTFKPFTGKEVQLTPLDFETLCVIEHEYVNLAQMKEDNMDGVGLGIVQSLEEKLIPEGFAKQVEGKPGVYEISDMAVSGEYIAHIERINPEEN